MSKSVIIAFLLALLVPAQALFAAPWKVGADGNADITMLKATIHEAENGDTILVYPGTYKGLRVAINKTLVILGVNGPEETILDGQGADFAFWISVAGASSHIEGFTFLKCTSAKLGGAINLVNGGSPTIRNNIFRGCEALFGGAIYCSPQTNPIIENNLFVDNISGSWGGAIYSQVGGPVIRNNTFIHNNAENGGGALAFHDAYPKISNNIFADGLSPSTVFLKTSRCKAEFQCNAFWNDHGKPIGFGEGVKASGDPSMLTADPLFLNSELYLLSDKSPYGKNGKCGRLGWR